jgi:hypothetical protein
VPHIAPKAAKRVVPRLAALPPGGKPTATDAPITVLRGGPLRYAQSVRTEPAAATPVIRVIRGARVRPTAFWGMVQPGPLILRLPD